MNVLSRFVRVGDFGSAKFTCAITAKNSTSSSNGGNASPDAHEPELSGGIDQDVHLPENFGCNRNTHIQYDSIFLINLTVLCLA